MASKSNMFNILDELKSCKGYEIALFTTFNFEIPYFERAIFGRLYSNGVNKISVFVDSSEFTKALKEVKSCYLGRKYMVTPFDMNGSFHPKVILLLGKKKAKLIVGSGNLKSSGYERNNEVFNVIEYTEKKSEYLDVIKAAVNFFSDINDKSYGLDNELIKEAKGYSYLSQTTSGNKDRYMLNNLSESILEQVIGIIDEPISEICVAVPYYDKELRAVKTLASEFSNAKIQLYIQDKKSTFPKEFNNKHNIVSGYKVFSGFRNGGENTADNFYHGKVFLFKGKKHEYVLYGSANCTQSALTKSFAAGGNIECDFLDIGKKKEFDYFFSNMKLSSSSNLQTCKMFFDNSDKTNFYFKYGEVIDDIVLRVGYAKQPNELDIYLFNEKLKYKYIGNELIINVPKSFVELTTGTLDLKCNFDGKEEILRCWFYDKEALYLYRTLPSNRFSLEKFEVDSEGDKYVEDYTNLLTVLSDMQEMKEFSRTKALLKQIQQEKEGENIESTDDDFVVDVPIREYDTGYKKCNILSGITQRLNYKFISNMPKIFRTIEIRDDGLIDESSASGNAESHARRSPTTQELKFKRYVTKIIGKLTNEDVAKIIEPEHYFSFIATIMNIFEKYRPGLLEKDIFDINYIIKNRFTLYKRILDKELVITKELQDIQQTIISKYLTAILESHLITQKYANVEDKNTIYENNKKYLQWLEQKFLLRDEYKPYLEFAIENKESAVYEIGLEKAIDIIEDYYGYKNYAGLGSYIKERYSNATVQFTDDTLYIISMVTDYSGHRVPLRDVIDEIRNYNTQYGNPISKTIISLTFTQDKNIKSLEYTIKISSIDVSWTSVVNYKRGNCIKSNKPQRY